MGDREFGSFAFLDQYLTVSHEGPVFVQRDGLGVEAFLRFLSSRVVEKFGPVFPGRLDP